MLHDPVSATQLDRVIEESETFWYFFEFVWGRKLPAATQWFPSGGSDRAEVWSGTDPPSWTQTVSHT